MGICSRREADRLISDGLVLVNGSPAVSGQRIAEGDSVVVNGRTVNDNRVEPPVLIAFNKPKGIICTSGTKDGGSNIINYIGYKSRIFPVGRLDKDSEGLILLTNRGELVNGINRARYRHEKEYTVSCADRVSDDFLKKMSGGVRIMVPEGREADGKKSLRQVTTRKCSVKRIDSHTFSIIITQGYNRQIRRMCEALGNKVVFLKRVRIMNILLGDLPEGKYRLIEGRELEALEALLKPEG